MGVEGACRSANGGGCPLLHALYISNGFIYSRLFPESPALQKVKKASKQGKKGQKLDFIWIALVFPRENRRQQTAKFKIYLSFEDCRASVVALSLGRWSCPLGAGGRAFGVVLTFWACPLLWWLVPCFPSWHISSRNRAKRGKNEFLFGVSWCFLGNLGCRKGRNLNIFLKCGKKNRR